MAETARSPTDTEDKMELDAIFRKPNCFLVLGKPGAGKTRLARRIASSQHCEYVDYASAIGQEIEKETDVGKKCEDLLLKGQVIPEGLVVEALISKLESNRLAHCGYVLDGLPSRCEEWVAVEEQLAFIQDLKLTPDFIINLRIPDADLKERRLGFLVDSETNLNYGKEKHSLTSLKDEKEDSETDGSEENNSENDDEKEDSSDEAENLKSLNREPQEKDPFPTEPLSGPVLNRLVKSPADMEASIERDIQWYKEQALQKLEDFMAAWDRQKLIELDANQPEEELFKQLMYKLHTVVLHPSYEVRLLVDEEHEEDGDNEDEEDVDDDDEMLRNLASSSQVAKGYRWRLSLWKRYCPVELKEGNLVKGKSRFSVSFLDKMYCLSSAASLKLFSEDPRFYLESPQPLVPCKMAVVGPHLSGKTTLAKALAEHYNAKYLNPDELVKPFWQKARDEQLAKAKDDAIHNAIQAVIATEAAKQAQAQAQAQQEDGGGISAESSGISLPEITAEHADVVATVEKTMEEAETVETPVTDGMLVEAVKEGINAVHEAHAKQGTLPRFGRWVIDGFPRNKDQWLLLSEMKSAMPDDVLWLRDTSPAAQELVKRYRQLKGEDTVGELKSGAEQQQGDQQKDPVTAEYENKKAAFDLAWAPLSQVIKGSAIDPIAVGASYASLREVTDLIDARFTHKAREYTQDDEQEDDEDAETIQRQQQRQQLGDDDDDDNDTFDDEMTGGGDEESLKEFKPWGWTKHYCPVTLKERGVLWPGSPELACKYREMLYQFSSQDAKERFISNPDFFMDVKIPPLRLLLLGTKGSGKTDRGRELAAKLGIFHVSFHEHLQEMLMRRTCKRISADDEGDEEAEQETTGNDIELSAEETAIKAFLEEGTALPEGQFKGVIEKLWHSEPFKGTGFILEGCPASSEDAQVMADAGLYPDCAVLLTIQEDDAVKRLFPERARVWRERRARRTEKREEEKRKRNQERAEAREKLKEEKVAQFKEQWEAKKRSFEADRDSEDEEEDGGDELPDEEVALKEFLEEEMPEEEVDEEDDEDEETEEDAMERIKSRLAEKFDEEGSRIGQVLETLDDNRVHHVKVNASRKPAIVLYSLKKMLKNVIEFRESIFSRCVITDPLTARNLLHSGYKKPSKFGHWCPVALSHGAAVQSQRGPGYPSYPVLYGNSVYYLSDTEARKAFTHSPVKYVGVDAPGPVVPIRLAIIGPPKSGKSTLAKRFEDEYGCVCVSVGSAIRFVLESQPNSDLCKQIKAHLKSGCVVPDDMAMQAVFTRLLDIQCQTRGYILDGFPSTKKQVELMTKLKIIPVRVIELELDEAEIIKRGKKEREDPNKVLPLHDSESILRVRSSCCLSHISGVRDWYQKNHRNWHNVDGSLSKWKQWVLLSKCALQSVKVIQKYLHRVNQGFAACIADLCVTPKECLARLGEYGQYCPVSLNSRGELFDCSVHKTLDYTAEYQRKYYRMASASDMELFLATPEKFCGDGATRKLPERELLPRKRTLGDVKAMFPKKMELQGYCPVTYLDGNLRYEHLVPGDQNLVVEYQQKLFCFASEEKMEKFLRLPGKYWDLKLPKKLPPIRQPVPIASLPMLGYMEQSVVDSVIKALTAVGCLKPKYPFVDAKSSALLFLAYHLKAFNPKLSEYTRKKYMKKLSMFEDNCDLISYLSQKMGSEYVMPEERPIDFDFKLTKFLGLKIDRPSVR